jgi:ribonuclease G
MTREIIVNVDSLETRVACLEDGVLVELYIERNSSRSVVGNIYKGKVTNVLPGMQAAFVDIGLERNAFLYVDDIIPARGANESNEDDLEEIAAVSINDVLSEGQGILVQVTKEPIGTKGARVISCITIPGRYLVLIPTVSYVGISRRIKDERERERLKKLTNTLKPNNMGVIVRTAAEGKNEAEIAKDIKFLLGVWRRISEKGKKAKAPVLLYEDHDLVYRIVRDLFTEDVNRFVIDSKIQHMAVLELLEILGPHLKRRVQLYDKDINIFDYYGIEDEIRKALDRRVWLNCGGYLVIDETEALTCIDVNTGKFIGTTTLADTVLRTNLDAAKEIARQIRLRNLAGIIIVDFIDMESVEEQRKVIEEFEAAMKNDKAKIGILGFTELGLLQITRKKVHEALSDVLERDCPYCEGTGKVLSEETMAVKVEREIRKFAQGSESEAILIMVHPSVAAMVIGAGGSNLSRIERETGRFIYIKGCDSMHLEEIKVVTSGDKEQIEKHALPVKEGQILEVKIEEPHVSNHANGIARLEGYVIDVDEAASLIGQKTRVQIHKAYRTYAKGRLVP